MTARSVLENLLVGSLSGVFLYAASFKILTSTPLQRTLVELGVGTRLALPAARLIPLFETTVGLAVIGFAPPVVAVMLVILAAIGIGFAGLQALRRGAKIRCSCFSSHSPGLLGRRQLILALLFVVAAILLAISSPSNDGGLPADRLLVVSLAGAGLQLLMMARDLLPLVRYRRATSTVYPI